MNNAPAWDHPHWYDLHDIAYTAGAEREPEHYRELLLALPPLDRDDHLVDVGAGTGKMAALVASGYPRLGRLTLIEPNEDKLAIAHERLSHAIPDAQIATIAAGLGVGAAWACDPGHVLTVGSVLMPIMIYRGGTLAQGRAWLRNALADIVTLVAPGGWVYLVETLALFADHDDPEGPVRRLTMRELRAEVARAGLQEIECVYRFRDRVILRAGRGES